METLEQNIQKLKQLKMDFKSNSVLNHLNHEEDALMTLVLKYKSISEITEIQEHAIDDILNKFRNTSIVSFRTSKIKELEK